MQALKAGTAIITASAAGVSDTCEITVLDAPNAPDFSNAKYDLTLSGTIETLQISNIKLGDNTNFYYIITSNNTMPEIKYHDNGFLDNESMSDYLENFSLNSDENYIYTRNLSKYVELNQDLYLWVIAETSLGNYYYDENGTYVSATSKLLVNGKELERPDLPQLNLILQSFSIGAWSSTSGTSDKTTSIRFNFPTDTTNRKFTLKIGKVTDTSILNKIRNNDYSGITDLLSYAKTHNGIYTEELTTTGAAYFRTDSTLFDGNSLLENKAYYYIYAVFDDENGKYYPIEGVTLGQAWLSSISDSWDLLAYTSSDFEWDNLTPSGDNPASNTLVTDDPTISTNPLPDTGANIILIGLIFIFVFSGIIFFVKYNKFKFIK